jgi:hypothetical protein
MFSSGPSADLAVEISLLTAAFGMSWAWALSCTVARAIVPSRLIWPPGW